MKVLIVADPIESLLPESDTGLSFAREALQQKHRVYWSTANQLELLDGTLRSFSSPLKSFDPGTLPQLSSSAQWIPIRDFDSVWIRKDPPFNEDYQSLCWLLSLEENHVSILNRPSQLIRYHEKLLPLETVQQGFLKKEQVLSFSLSTGENWPQIQSDDPIVTKPWLGFGGHGVNLWTSFAELKNSSQKLSPRYQIVQAFQEKIKTQGDRRVFFLEGQYFGDFVRIPKKESIQSNLSQGGSAQLKELNSSEKEIITGLSQFFKKIDLVFAGADFLAGKLSEINITAPTGVEMLKKLTGKDLAKTYVQIAEKRATKK